MKIDRGKELWLALLFICVGFTVWPLICYFGGRALGVDYFVNMELRDWAENRVYGPLADGGLRALARVFFLCGPYLFVSGIRLLLHVTGRRAGEEEAS